ncbi:hypothetical protein [Isoptericola sp. NPDC055881]
MFIRVKDHQTGHEFDRQENDPAVLSGRFEQVKPKLYPPSPLARPAKHHTKLAGRTASRETRPNTSAAEAPEKEN